MLTYTAAGVNVLTLGNNITEQVTWNDRLQPTALQVKTSSQTSLRSLSFYPCSGTNTYCSTGNNGNLQSQTMAIPGLTLTQGYSYDNLSRLTGATESSATSQSYAYTGNGNRYVTGQAASLPALTAETPQAASWYTSSSVLNRINTRTCDPNGSVKQVGGLNRTFTYDAENRQRKATIDTTSASYAYDGNGSRVQKTAGSRVNTYVYEAFGNLAAEYVNQSVASLCGTTV